MNARVREAWLVTVIAGVCAAGIVEAARSSYFYGDDWLNFGQARDLGMSWRYLRLSYFGHFAPVHRALDWLWAVQFPLNWNAYLAVMVALHATAVAATYVLLRVLRCRVLLAAMATAMFASSVVWVRLIQWPASSEHVACGLAATAVSLAASMLWFQRRSPWLVALAAGAMVAGLLSYEKPALIVMYVVLLRYLVLAPSLRPRALLAQARADWPLLAALFGAAAVYAVVLHAGGYGTVAERPSTGQMLEFLKWNWLRGTSSLVIGQAQVQPWEPIPRSLVILAQVVLAAAVVVSIMHRRRAWRAWAFLIVCWLVNVGIIGLSRIVDFGIGVGVDPRYNAEMALLLPLAIALAFGAPDSATHANAPPAAGRRPPLLATALPVTVAAMLLAASCATAYPRIERFVFSGVKSRAWADQVRATAPALSGPDGRVSVIDAKAPFEVVNGGFPPYDRLSTVLPLVLKGRADFDGGGERPAVVELDGRVRPARLTPVWTGRFPAQECGPGIVRRTVDNGKEERPGLLRVGVQAPERPAQIDVVADYGAGRRVRLRPIRLEVGGETGGVMADMKGLRTIELSLPADVCVRSLATVLAD